MTDTVFTKVDYTLGSLIDAIDIGTIGLPDIQRPFVWKNAKVRNLFDSMFRGYPVGYLLLWDNINADDTRAIGTSAKQKIPQQLIVDGQQRLTSLYAVVRGVQVVRENYDEERIRIAFNPLLSKFEVTDAAILKDKAYLPDISVLWKSDADLFEITEDYLAGLRSIQEVGDEDRRKIQKGIQRLQNLSGFPFTALTLSTAIDPEEVAEVFVRINSEGKKLNQADFILTLMSVFWDEGRKQLEEFSRHSRQPAKGIASPANHFIEPSPDQLLKASIGVGFRRARLKSVYSILRGRDAEGSGLISDEREKQFAILKDAQARALDLNNWHSFLKAIHRAGFRSWRTISSQNNLLFAYILFLLGKTEYGIEAYHLERLIARWFFMTALTGRYTSSPESSMEFDLARFRSVNSGEAFTAVLEELCTATLTADFWSITLPSDLATSSARSPSLFAYMAALNLLEAKALFSEHKVSDLMDPSVQSTRSGVERHHLFPKAHLYSIGVVDSRETNQIANYAVTEWSDNSQIGDRAPPDYLPDFKDRFSGQELERMYYWHALPDQWESLEYSDFLKRRRELMAKVIRDAYQLLIDPAKRDKEAPENIAIEAIVGQGETDTIEFKSTLRINLHTGERDPRMELAVLKTVAAFVNSHGGTLIIGVTDDGEPVGIETDKFPNEDKMNLHLVNLLKERIGPQHSMYIHPRFDDYEEARVMAVDCIQGKEPVYVKDGNNERFYVRNGAATVELTASQTQQYINGRFS